MEKKFLEEIMIFFKRPLHIIFDAEIMEVWDGLPKLQDLPSNFKIDYVRVWRKEE